MANSLAAPTASNIKYLIAIYGLGCGGGGVRCTEVAKALQVTKPSVHSTTMRLIEMQLIHKDRYGMVFLTETGKRLAAQYAKYLEVICGHFDGLLPVSSDSKSIVYPILAQLSVEDISYLCDQMGQGHCED